MQLLHTSILLRNVSHGRDNGDNGVTARNMSLGNKVQQLTDQNSLTLEQLTEKIHGHHIQLHLIPADLEAEKEA